MRFDESGASFESPCARSQRSTVASKMSIRWQMSLQDLEQHEDDVWQAVEQLQKSYSGLRKEACRVVEQHKMQTKEKINGLMLAIESALKMMDCKIEFVVDSCDAYRTRINQLMRNMEDQLQRQAKERSKVTEIMQTMTERVNAMQERSEKQAIREEQYARCLQSVQQINQQLSQQLNRSNERSKALAAHLQAEILVRNELIKNLQERCGSYERQIAQSTPEINQPSRLNLAIGGESKSNQSPLRRQVTFSPKREQPRMFEARTSKDSSFEINTNRIGQAAGESSYQPNNGSLRRTIIAPEALRLADFVVAQTETCVFEDYRESLSDVSSQGTCLFYTEQ